MSALGESLHKHRSQGMDREPVWFLCDSWFLAANQSSNKGREWCSCSGREVSPLWAGPAMRKAQQLCFLRTATLWAPGSSLGSRGAEPHKGFASLWGISELTRPHRSTLPSRTESCLRSFHWQHFTEVRFHCQVKLRCWQCTGVIRGPFYTCSAAELLWQQREA